MHSDGSSPPWLVQILALFLTGCVAMAVFVFNEIIALATIPLIVFGLALARRRSWALFAICATLASFSHAFCAGSLPSWIMVTMAATAAVVCSMLPWALRFDALATVLSLALSIAAGLLIAHGADYLTTRHLQMVTPSAPRFEPPAKLAGGLVDTRAARAGQDRAPSSATPVAPVTRVCRQRAARESAVSYRRLTRYDFIERLRPVAFGPRIVERERLPFGQEPHAIRRLLTERQEQIGQCYRWARYHGSRSLAGTLHLSGKVEVWGDVSVYGEAFVARDDRARGQHPLTRCVARVLRGLPRLPPRGAVTRFETSIIFSPSTQKPDRPPGQPDASAPPHSPPFRQCVLISPPRQIQPTKIAPLRVDDFDEAQAARERRRACRRSRLARDSQGRLHHLSRRCLPRIIVHKLCRSCGLHLVLPKELLQRNLRYNMGAYRQCYRQNPKARGSVALRGMINEAGFVENVIVARAKARNSALARCLRRAVADVTFPPFSSHLSESRVVFDYTFELDPTPARTIAVPKRTTAAKLEAIASGQLAAGDGRAAHRSYSALLSALPDAPRSCWWRLGALEAALAIAPWGGQRVEAAAKAFHQEATLREHRARWPRCLDQAASAIAKIAMRYHRDGHYVARATYYRQAVHWYRLALAGWSPKVRVQRLRYYLAEALYAVHDYHAATRNYALVARGPKLRFRKEATAALRALSAARPGQ
jgi:hypothetical protein